MKYIFGLGNPGKKYHYTRHNAGALFVEHVVQQSSGSFVEKKKLHSLFYQDKKKGVICIKPTSFMNESGRAVRAVLDYFSVLTSEKNDEIVVVYDDLDLELGTYKLQFAKGPKVHNGVNSVVQYLQTDRFWHLRIGIDARSGDRSIPGKSYVLQQLPPEEQEVLHQVFHHIYSDLILSDL